MTHAGASYGDILMPTALKCQRMDGSREALWPEEAFQWARQEVLTWFQSPANRKRPAGFLSAPSVNYTTRYHGRIKVVQLAVSVHGAAVRSLWSRFTYISEWMGEEKQQAKMRSSPPGSLRATISGMSNV